MKSKIIKILEVSKSDDLERARMCFKGLSAKEMLDEHGRSGRTRQEILDGYLSRNKEIDEMIAWVESK